MTFSNRTSNNTGQSRELDLDLIDHYSKDRVDASWLNKAKETDLRRGVDERGAYTEVLVGDSLWSPSSYTYKKYDNETREGEPTLPDSPGLQWGGSRNKIDEMAEKLHSESGGNYPWGMLTEQNRNNWRQVAKRHLASESTGAGAISHGYAVPVEHHVGSMNWDEELANNFASTNWREGRDGIQIFDSEVAMSDQGDPWVSMSEHSDSDNITKAYNEYVKKNMWEQANPGIDLSDGNTARIYNEQEESNLFSDIPRKVKTVRPDLSGSGFATVTPIASDLHQASTAIQEGAKDWLGRRVEQAVKDALMYNPESLAGQDPKNISINDIPGLTWYEKLALNLSGTKTLNDLAKFALKDPKNNSIHIANKLEADHQIEVDLARNRGLDKNFIGEQAPTPVGGEKLTGVKPIDYATPYLQHQIGTKLPGEAEKYVRGKVQQAIEYILNEPVTLPEGLNTVTDPNTGDPITLEQGLGPIGDYTGFPGGGNNQFPNPIRAELQKMGWSESLIESSEKKEALEYFAEFLELSDKEKEMIRTPEGLVELFRDQDSRFSELVPIFLSNKSAADSTLSDGMYNADSITEALMNSKVVKKKIEETGRNLVNSYEEGGIPQFMEEFYKLKDDPSKGIWPQFDRQEKQQQLQLIDRLTPQSKLDWRSVEDLGILSENQRNNFLQQLNSRDKATDSKLWERTFVNETEEQNLNAIKKFVEATKDFGSGVMDTLIPAAEASQDWLEQVGDTKIINRGDGTHTTLKQHLNLPGNVYRTGQALHPFGLSLLQQMGATNYTEENPLEVLQGDKELKTRYSNIINEFINNLPKDRQEALLRGEPLTAEELGEHENALQDIQEDGSLNAALVSEARKHQSEWGSSAYYNIFNNLANTNALRDIHRGPDGKLRVGSIADTYRFTNTTDLSAGGFLTQGLNTAAMQIGKYLGTMDPSNPNVRPGGFEYDQERHPFPTADNINTPISMDFHEIYKDDLYPESRSLPNLDRETGTPPPREVPQLTREPIPFEVGANNWDPISSQHASSQPGWHEQLPSWFQTHSWGGNLPEVFPEEGLSGYNYSGGSGFLVPAEYDPTPGATGSGYGTKGYKPGVPGSGTPWNFISDSERKKQKEVPFSAGALGWDPISSPPDPQATNPLSIGYSNNPGVNAFGFPVSSAPLDPKPSTVPDPWTPVGNYTGFGGGPQVFPSRPPQNFPRPPQNFPRADPHGNKPKLKINKPRNPQGKGNPLMRIPNIAPSTY